MAQSDSRKWVKNQWPGLLLFWLLLACRFLGSEASLAQDCSPSVDCLEPDSVYYLPFTYRLLPCAESVEVRVPVFLWSDRNANDYVVLLKLFGGASFDTAYSYNISQCIDGYTSVVISADRHACGAGVHCYSDLLTPGFGVVANYILHCQLGDTVTLAGSTPIAVWMGDMYSWWQPLYRTLDTSFVVPSEIPVSPGDVNCSQSVSISDAVFLINYIFAGGCAPCNANAADINGNCAISISDVVYLINYIFAGGSAPLPGCVVP